MSASPLRTARTVLIPISVADLDETAALWADPVVMEHRDAGPRTREQTKSILAAAERCWRTEGWGVWAIRDPETGGLLGEAGLRHSFDIDAAPVVFDFTVGRRQRGQGIEIEAGHVILEDAWDRYGGDLVHAITVPGDRDRAATLRTLGFREADRPVVHGQPRCLWELPRLR